MTQIDLAKEFNTTHSNINRYENGVHHSDTDTLSRFADFFNESTDYLLDRTDYGLVYRNRPMISF